MPRADAPEAAVVLCPDCGEEQVHDVLQAAGQGEGAQHATVRCRECSRVHRTVLRPPTYVEVPIIISRGEASERTTVQLPEDEFLAVEDEIVAAGQQVQVRTIDRRDGKRVRSAKAGDIATLWVIHFEEIMVKVSVNMGERTISKSVPVGPRDTFTVGDEFDLDRLRIYIHAIRTPEGTIHRGTAEAMDIRRIFARPVRLTPEERRERRQQLGMPEPKPRRRAPPGMARQAAAREGPPRKAGGTRPPRPPARSEEPARPTRAPRSPRAPRAERPARAPRTPRTERTGRPPSGERASRVSRGPPRGRDEGGRPPRRGGGRGR